MSIYRIGLIGFSIGGHVFHAPFIADNPDLNLYKVTARRPEHKAMLQERYPEAIAVEDAQEIFEDPLVDIVVIATSNDVHYSFALEALKAGKHVIVEKPFTNFSNQADELIALAKKKGLLLSVHHNARFHSDFKTVKEVLASGKLGRVVNYEARYDRFRNYLRKGAWREENLPGSGIHYDLGAHLIDQALQLFGAPDGVYADLRVQRDGAKAVDDFEIILDYPGKKISLKGQMLASIPTARYAVYGTNGSFVKWGIDPQEALLRDGAIPRQTENWGKEDESIYGQLSVCDASGELHEQRIESQIGSNQDFYANIVGVLNGQQELIVRPEQARDVIRILELSEQSHKEARRISLKGELLG